ncbi:MAG: metallophosphoesterase [Polyangia bacterium]|jgi:3',5'-cyclic AMP phosphodiesterase CpdA|nr:metallophosphoesterase [Polyangia bacterium]
MRLLHLSDLHLSRYGESGPWIPRTPGEETEVLHTWQRWQVEGLRSRRQRQAKLRLVDPEGVVHQVKGWPRKDERIIQALITLAEERHRTSAERLIGEPPGRAELKEMLGADPVNTNLLFLEMLEQVLPLEPDLVVITGDITDNGFGYNLILHHLAPWIARGRLLAVPGNHDTYDIFPRKGRRVRIAAKVRCNREFMTELGLAPEPHGAWAKRFEDLIIVGLDSCHPPLTPLSASGKVTEDQLDWLDGLARQPDFRGARLRLGLLHHHLLRMPFALGKRNPIEMAMRLRNAPDVMERCRQARLDILLNGHRHHGYMVQLPDHPMVISSPSSTLGCKFTRTDYAWHLDLGARHPFPEMRAFKGYRSRGGLSLEDELGEAGGEGL